MSSLKDKLLNVVNGDPARKPLAGKSVFLSASWPSPERDPRYFEGTDVREISNGVVELAKAVFEAGGTLVFGGHPTISPLIRSIVAEGGAHQVDDEPRVKIYQSGVFPSYRTKEADMLDRLDSVERCIVPGFEEEFPRFFKNGTLDHSSIAGSLEKMRKAMVDQSEVVGAVFIGGMEGVEDEFRLAREAPWIRRYLVCAPGGAAALLARDFEPAPSDSPRELQEGLRTSRLYPWLMRSIVDDCLRS